MAAPTNTVQTYAQIGRREDLSDIIYDISPTETPFMNSIGKTKADNTYTEWQTDALASADATNAVVEGDDVTADTYAATTRVGTYTQLMDKAVTVSNTANAVNTAGRKQELSYQMAKRSKELKRDIEARITGNYASSAGNSTAARTTAGALAWLTSNVSRGTSGANGGFSSGTVSAATNGNTRTYTETLLKAVLKSVWDSGGNPTMVLTGSAAKQTASSFTGIADARRETGNKQARIIGAADVYVSDFGEVAFVPDRFCSTRDALVVDPEYWDIAYLQPFSTEELAKTGHAEKRMIKVELALRCLNQAASGVVADLA